MAKQALLGVLESTIGKYVLDLDAEKLNLGIWSGKVELHDLHLDIDACNGELDRQAAEAPNLAIPLKVVGGSFQSLVLDIPWTNLTKQSVVMKAQGFHVHMAPHDRLRETDFLKLSMSSEDKRAHHIQQQRARSIALSNRNRLQRNEFIKQFSTSNSDENNKDDAKSSGMVARLVKRIVENLQVEINDVQVTLQGKEGMAGVVLGNLSFVTTDMAGHRAFVDRTGTLNPSDLLNKFLYKKLQIQGFGLYVQPSDHDSSQKYILGPLKFEATLREADASITREYPKWLLKSKVPVVQLGLSQAQYRAIVGLMAAMAPSPDVARPLFPEYRPLHRVTANSARDWWQYAYRCVGRLTGRRSWMTFFQAFKARKKYVSLYKRKAHVGTAKWVKPLTLEEEADLYQLEEDMSTSVEGIMSWRNFADAQMEKERLKQLNQQRQQSKKQSSLLSNLFGGKSSTSTLAEETPITLSPDELKELENVGLDETDNSNELFPDAKLCRVEFVLSEFRVHMTKETDQPMLELEMGRVLSSFESDAGGSFDFQYSLQSLDILDHLHTSSLFPKILRSLQGPEGLTKCPPPRYENVFQVNMSKSKEGDKKLTVKLIPFEAVFAPHLITDLVDFIDVNFADSSPQIQGLDDKDDYTDIIVMKERQETSTTSLRTKSLSNALVDAWIEKTKEKTSLAIDLDLQAPILVFPENISDPRASVVILDLGGFRFRHGFLDASPKVTEWMAENPRNGESPAAGTVVDNGCLELENMTLLVGEAASWRSVTSMRENHRWEKGAIIEPVTVRLDFGVESVVSGDMPRVCMFTTIATTNFKFSPYHLWIALRVYNAWIASLDRVHIYNNRFAPSPSKKPAQEDVQRASTTLTPKKREDPAASSARGQHIATEAIVKLAIDGVTNTVESTFTDDTSLLKTVYLEITAEKYSCVLYDSGEFQQGEDAYHTMKSISGPSSPLVNIAEGLALEGGMQFRVSLARDKSGDTSRTTVDIEGKDFEIFTGFGIELKGPLQILEPVTGTLKVNLQSQGLVAQKIDVKARCQDAFDLTISMRNLSLIMSIANELSQCIVDGVNSKIYNDTDREPVKTLDEKTTKHIEALALALEGKEDAVSALKRTAKGRPLETVPVGIDEEGACSSVVTINLNIPTSKVAIINDLQGLDEALFRIETQEFVSKGMVAVIRDIDGTITTQTIFNIKLHAMILADYYDPSVNSWKPLLKRPWELDCKSERARDHLSTNGRFQTRADIHFFPLHLAFSEHFLIGLGSANRMLSMSAEMEKQSKNKSGNEKGVANDAGFNPRASVNRNLVAALPYALDNYSGLDVEYLLTESQVGNRSCPNGTMQYFKFNPPKARGSGGKRLYGDDVVHDLSITIFVSDDDTISIECIDDELGMPKRFHVLKDGTMLVTTVVKEGLTTVLRLSSNLYIRNRTPLPARVTIEHDSQLFDVGVCSPTSSLLDQSKARLVPYNVKEGTLSKPSKRLGVRFSEMTSLVKKWTATGKGLVSMKISPQLESFAYDLNGKLEFEADIDELSAADNQILHLRIYVVCKASDASAHDFVLQAAVTLQLIQGIKVFACVALEPRAMLVSTIPLLITVLTRLPYCYSVSNAGKSERSDAVHTIHELESGSKIEVYSGGDALAVKLRLTDNPCEGTPTGTSRHWITIPLSTQLDRPILSFLPFVTNMDKGANAAPKGSEFFIAEATPALPDFFFQRFNDDSESNELAEPIQRQKSLTKTFLFTVGSYGVDHTCSILFEQPESEQGFFGFSTMKQPLPFGAFADEGDRQRISLLPTSEIPIQLVCRNSSGGLRTAPFRIDEVSMSKGGAQATPLLWEDGSESGYFAYRHLVSSFQSALHIIPEFLVFNGSGRHHVVVKQKGGADVKIAPLDSAALFPVDYRMGLPLSFHYESIGGVTKTRRLEQLGLHIDLVCTTEGNSLGSLAVQTSIGSNDSRLLIKLGEVGKIEQEPTRSVVGLLPSSFIYDILRFRIHADEFAVTLNQAIVGSAENNIGTLERAGGLSKSARQPIPVIEIGETPNRNWLRSKRAANEKPICTITANRIIYDVQRLFKNLEELSDENDVAERCQLSLIVHDFKIQDETPKSPFPLVFQYKGGDRFLDLCVRTKGPLYGRHVKVDLFDLILAHSGRGDEHCNDRMFFQTSEHFVWKLIDTADLISQASKGPKDNGDFDKALAAYVPSYTKEQTGTHTPPQVETIYDIAVARVSPFNVTVSFKRNPDAMRYDKFINNESAHLMRYFTQQLRFTIDKCDLCFSRYEEKSLKGPRDRLIEILTAVYISRIKLKVVSILAAASFGDWKDHTVQDDGDDEFVDGDLLRVTGNVAGNSVAFAFNKVGKTLGSSVKMGFGAIGEGVETGAAIVGAHGFGSGVNKVVSGVGGFAGGTLHGVGEGAGSLFKGAGEGLGLFFGGIADGGSSIFKGVGKSIITGDSGALASGFVQGLDHMGSGVQNSVKAVGTGVGGSVTSVVKGSFTGVIDSVNKASIRSSRKQGGLAKLREDFQNQDFT